MAASLKICLKVQYLAICTSACESRIGCIFANYALLNEDKPMIIVNYNAHLFTHFLSYNHHHYVEKTCTFWW